MKLTIVYDNDIFKKGLGLKSDWGFACLIETKNDTVLFDTGAKGKILLNNMKLLDINPKQINKIVISHEHWDHNGGLKDLITYIEKAEIFRPKSQKDDNKIKHRNSKESTKISEEIYTTGILKGTPVDEQSLVLKGKKNWYALTGCSHSGVDNILKTANKIGYTAGIIGGFHGFNKFKYLEKLNLIYPCHCTKYKKQIIEMFPDKAKKCGVGKTIDL